MIALDTSVAVAAALPWHEAHVATLESLRGERTPLIAQVAVETYSVLTRLPPPHRVPAPVALAYLEQAFILPPLTLSTEGHVALLDLAANASIIGGAIYDGIVAKTAHEAGLTLLTLDQRAVSTYRSVGVDHRFVV